MGKVLDDRKNGQGPKMTKINRKCDSRSDGFGFTCLESGSPQCNHHFAVHSPESTANQPKEFDSDSNRVT